MPTLEDYMVEQGRLSREAPPAENPAIFKRDIGPLMSSME
jgi:hypothetical protein